MMQSAMDDEPWRRAARKRGRAKSTGNQMGHDGDRCWRGAQPVTWEPPPAIFVMVDP